MPATFACLRVETENDLATITLDRAPLNVLTIAMIHELDSALDDLAANKHVKAVVLRAEGRAFCAGVDVADHGPDRVEAMIRGFNRLVVRLRAFPTPTVAVVHGAALGGGAELAIACDLVLAADDARPCAAFAAGELERRGEPPATLLDASILLDALRRAWA